MSSPLEFTGERFTPECEREIWYEHFHRYVLAIRWCGNMRTLDAACGEGYGAALLSEAAESVEAVDISEAAVAHARQRYGDINNLRFEVADCTELPFEDDEFDRIVSFETLEHLAEQDELLAEFRRVLKPDGLLVLSSPDKAVYSDQQSASNEFHVRELYRDELEELIQRYFPAYQLLGQKLAFHSMIWSLDGVGHVALDQMSGVERSASPVPGQPPMYYLALCAADESFLPDSKGRLWLFDDKEESVYQHYHGEIRRNMSAGGRIADLEKEIRELRDQTAQLKPTWWQRLFGKH